MIHSPFAEALFKGLEGAADIIPADGGNGVITASELYLYIREQLESQTIDVDTGLKQTPQFYTLDRHDNGEFIFLNPRHRLFISYSHRDKEFLNTLTSDLENVEISVWIDEKKIKVGDSITQRIEKGISGCDFFCLVISEHSVKSNWVGREYNAALNEQLSSGTPTILPLLIQEVELPFLLKDIKYADFSRDYNDGIKELLKAIKRQ